MTTPDKRKDWEVIAEDILRNKCRCSVLAAQSGVKHICYVCDFTKALRSAYLAGLEDSAKIAEKNEPSQKATEVLRCNPKEAKKPYIDSATMNGYDWACDDIAQAIRTRANEVKNAT